MHAGTLRSSGTNELIAVSAQLAGYYDNPKPGHFNEMHVIDIIDSVDSLLQPLKRKRHSKGTGSFSRGNLFCHSSTCKSEHRFHEFKTLDEKFQEATLRLV